jgi:hypothetical protein
MSGFIEGEDRNQATCFPNVSTTTLLKTAPFA